MGTYGSRSAAVGASAIVKSVEKVIEKGKRIAAHLLEAAAEDIVFEDGKFSVKGAPDKSKALGRGGAPGLPRAQLSRPTSSRAWWRPRSTTPPTSPIRSAPTSRWSRSTATPARSSSLRYVAVDDVGNVINPMIVDGQLHGGIAQGVGQALWEGAVYDEGGQLVTGELMDYAMPRAHNLVPFELDRTVTPCPHNPLGVKGVGEAGAIASPAAVVNAAVDALSHLGIRHIDMPLTSEKVWRAMSEAARNRPRRAVAREGLRCIRHDSTITAPRASRRRSTCSARSRTPSCSPAATACCR